MWTFGGFVSLTFVRYFYLHATVTVNCQLSTIKDLYINTFIYLIQR